MFSGLELIERANRPVQACVGGSRRTPLGYTPDWGASTLRPSDVIRTMDGGHVPREAGCERELD